MSIQEIIIGIGGVVVHHNPVILTCLGLGSCVGVAIYDKEHKLGGLAHVMLPNSKEYAGTTDTSRNLDTLHKYADVAIPYMLDEIMKLGAKKENIKAKIVGGSKMFDIPSKEKSIGERNIEAIKDILNENKIPLEAEDLGGKNGRTMRFDTVTQTIKIKSINGEKTI